MDAGTTRGRGGRPPRPFAYARRAATQRASRGVPPPSERRLAGGWQSGGVSRTPQGQRASLDKQPHEVAAMFDGVAERYDLTNTVLSFGQDRGWRRATRAALGLRPGERVLDVGAGTGVSTEELARPGRTRSGADLSLGHAARPAGGPGRRCRWSPATRCALPFADASLRRGDDLLRAAQRRRHRRGAARAGPGDPAGRPAGGLRVQPPRPNAAFRTVYLSYLMRSLPAVARSGVEQPRGVRLSRRVDPGLAGPGRRWPGGSPRPALGAGRLAQPDRRRRRAAPGDRE